ncbi:uncharacterized protein EDB91DRAFT_1255255 [Suillus paluster]|uniref:uncharacterized protein n=1 Tax=Suillus paluster TaxID=48578 RepID=UPI001B8663DB|nr:uncharacterized protein EDB91DRAFT_1255255 [Suillus paluster]KAG1724391.1 hypothetical protein EDB91DRAFT_1255255 [Suillus paluster]
MPTSCALQDVRANMNALNDWLAAQDADICALQDVRANMEAVQNQMKVMQQESVTRDETVRQAQAQLARQEQATAILQDCLQRSSPLCTQSKPYSGNHSASAMGGPSVGNVTGGSGWNGAGGLSASRSHNQIAGSSRAGAQCLWQVGIGQGPPELDIYFHYIAQNPIMKKTSIPDICRTVKSSLIGLQLFVISLVSSSSGISPGAIDIDIQNDMAAATANMASLATQLALGLRAAEKKLDEMGARLREWASVFTAVAISRPQWFNVMTSVGNYGAARMKMPNIGIEIVYGPGAMAVGSGRIIRHGVDMDTGLNSLGVVYEG